MSEPLIDREGQRSGCADLEHRDDRGTAVGQERRLLDEPKLTVPEAARKMGIGTTSLRRIIADGGIPVLKMTGRLLLLAADVEAFIRTARVQGGRKEPAGNRLPPLPKEVLASEHLR